MEAVKKICKAGGIICLAVAVSSKSAGLAVISVVLAAVAVGIEIKDWNK